MTKLVLLVFLISLNLFLIWLVMIAAEQQPPNIMDCSRYAPDSRWVFRCGQATNR